jgi:hypothetical protein
VKTHLPRRPDHDTQPTLDAGGGLLSNAFPLTDQRVKAAGVNDMFRQAGIAVGVAVLGALVPADAAFGDGSPQAYVDGMRNALWVGAGLAVVAAVCTALLIRGQVGQNAEQVGGFALEEAA